MGLTDGHKRNSPDVAVRANSRLNLSHLRYHYYQNGPDGPRPGGLGGQNSYTSTAG